MGRQPARGENGELALGRKLRELRRGKGLTLQQVADQAGLSKGFVSQVESGTVNPSIASLKRIADVLDTPLAALFEDRQNGEGAGSTAGSPDSDSLGEIRVVRRNRRKMLVWPGAEGRQELLTPDLRCKLEVLLSVFEPGHPTNAEYYSHEGEEFGFILEGRFEVTVAGHTVVLEEGDSIYFPSHLPHRSRAVGDRPARTLWVITPPSF